MDEDDSHEADLINSKNLTLEASSPDSADEKCAFLVTHKFESPDESEDGLKIRYTSLKKDAFEEKRIPVDAININGTTESNKLRKEIVELLAGLTVTIIFTTTSRRFPESLSVTEDILSMAHSKNSNVKNVIGRVFLVNKYSCSDKMGTCPCHKCQHSGKPSREWGKLMILTTAFDYSGESNTKCEIFDDCPVTLDDVSVRKSYPDDEWREFECVTCNLGLLDKLWKTQRHCFEIWKNLNGTNIKNRDYSLKGYSPISNHKTHEIHKECYKTSLAENVFDTTIHSKGFSCKLITIESVSLIVSSVSFIIALIAVVVVCLKIQNSKVQSVDVNSVSLKDKPCFSCADSSIDGTLEAIKKYLEEETTKSTQFKTSFQQDHISHTPSSAHIHLKAPPNIPGTEDDFEPNFINKDHIDAHFIEPTEGSSADQHARGVHVSEKDINIVHSGLYYIYSSVNFKPNTTKSSSEFAYQTWFHYVHRISPNSPMNSGVLLRTVFTSCPNCNEINESAFTGGIFHLQAGDKIRVCFSGQGFIGYDSKTSFLGLFMLVSPQDHHLDAGVGLSNLSE